jgi:20S proteasome alpha/beta subunit
MTVAAGFRFAGGVLLCADTEITGAKLKTRGTKIFPYEFSRSKNKIIFTFSGDVASSKMCIQQIARSVAASPDDTEDKVFAILASQLHDFHDKYIFKHPHYGYSTGPEVNLIIAVWSAGDKRLTLYESLEDKLTEVSELKPFAITGSGGEFASYIAKPLVPHEGMKMTDLVTVAVYALKEAKDNAPGCGKSSELITITDGGEIGNIGWLQSSYVESFAKGFEMGVKHLFVETCDLNTPETQVQERFNSLWAIIQATREHLRREKEKNLGLYALNDVLMGTIVGQKIIKL